MIVVDTNVIDAKLPTDPSVEMLVALARATGHRLYLPAVAWDEYTAHYKQRLAEKYEALVKKGRELEALAPEWRFEPPPFSDSSAAMSTNTHLQERFTPIPTSAGAPAEGLQREINKQPPARRGTGARDTVIWLSALKQMAASDGEELLIFYSHNTKDFANDSMELDPDLAREAQVALGAAYSRFRYCSNLNDLLAALGAKQSDATSTDFTLAADSPLIADEINALLASPSTFFDLSRPWASRMGALSSGGGVKPIALTKWTGQRRLTVGDVHYLVFAGTWQAEKLYTTLPGQPGDIVSNIKVTFHVEGTVVAQLNEAGTQIDAVSIEGLSTARDVLPTYVTHVEGNL